ncbi:MAG: HAMP domain-containing protein, partial [Treponema sp.]|nr:HAMP domain-containing protein [Treponema sp.]
INRVVFPALDSKSMMAPKGSGGCYISSLINDTEYSFTVKTVDTSGNKSEGVTIKATPSASAAITEYKFHETPEILLDGTNGTAGTNATYVYFGDWPQTIKAESVTVDETKTIVKGANTYYLGSDNYYYARCKENGYNANYKYSDGTYVKKLPQKSDELESIKYFKVEPIKWRVLKEENGKSLLLAENILAADIPYYESESRKEMAATYIEFGPDQGNVFMEKFDPYAEKISEDVDQFVDEQSKLLVEDISEIRKDSTSLIIIASVVSGISLVVLLILGFVISRLISKPIHDFTDILKDIAQGEGDLTHRIEIKSTDEIGDMATYFNQTFEKIRNLVSIVQSQANMLTNLGENLSSNMNETASAINEISTNISSIKTQTVTQSASVTETSSTMEQISSGIEKLNELINEQTANINTSASSMEELIRNIDSVAQTLIKNTENIQHLDDSSQSGKAALDKINDAIHEVAKESEGLMEISQVIQGIASQTNLLAMNAAIEAAHAGELGKGFAVVADEVRKLAESSSDQTKTITAVLKRIKDSITLVIGLSSDVIEQFASIENDVNTVARQEQTIRNAMEEQSDSSKQIHKAIDTLHMLTEKVQSSSMEMLEGSRQINEETKNMNNITQEIANGMGEMSTGAEEINKAVNSINELTVENKNSINALTTEVNKIKV